MEDGKGSDRSSILHPPFSILLFLSRRRSLGGGGSGSFRAGGGSSSLGASGALRASSRCGSAGCGSSTRCAGDCALGGLFLLSLRQRHLAMGNLRQAKRALAVVPLFFFLQLVQTFAARQHVAMTNQSI